MVIIGIVDANAGSLHCLTKLDQATRHVALDDSHECPGYPGEPQWLTMVTVDSYG